MKKIILLAGLVLPFLLVAERGVGQTSNSGVNNSINNSLNKAGSSLNGLFKKKKKDVKDTTQNNHVNSAVPSATAATATAATATQGPQAVLTSYQNYDFVPGNNVLFEDEFTDDQSGEFPTHWDLKKGQAILNMQGTDKAFFVTDGNYAVLQPLMKNNSYLTQNFSIEYDLYANGGYAPIIDIEDANRGGHLWIQVGKASASWSGYIASTDKTTDFAGNLPADIANDNFANKWHHIGITYKNDQMKVYVDKYRVLLVPHCNGLSPAYVIVQGAGDQSKPIIFKNFKIADGAQMYMTGQKFTDAKIVTHGINFDIDKATIKPESMGTINMIVRVMKDNPDIKFEVDGHTDNTGTSPHNLTLSQQRADAVVAQFVVMGVDASRLTSKGFGDTKPISDNATLEGKANNRRVEFIKL